MPAPTSRCFSYLVGVKMCATLLIFLIAQGCYHEEFTTETSFVNPIQKEDCGSDTVCTRNHQQIAVDLVCKNGERPDASFKAYFTETNEIINNLDVILKGEFLSFPIANDNHINKIDFNGTSITLEITISRFKSWKREFIVARDCCNVFSLENQELEFTL